MSKLTEQRSKRAKKITRKKEEEALHTSPSGINSFLSCRRKTYFHTIRQLTIKQGRLSLEIGTIWHTALEALYSWKSIGAAKKALVKAIQKCFTSGESAINTPASVNITHHMMMGMLLGYWDKFGKKDLKRWNFIAHEQKFRLPNFLNTCIDFVGIIDGIVEIKSGPNKGLWILEHKTTKDLAYYTLEGIKKSNQALSYIHAATELIGKKPRGIIWNAVRKPSKRQKKNQTPEEFAQELREDYQARPSFYFYRDEIKINKSTISLWLSEITQVLADMELCYTNPDLTDLWYKNTSICDMYGGCEFMALCNRGEKRSTLALYRTIER